MCRGCRCCPFTVRSSNSPATGDWEVSYQSIGSRVLDQHVTVQSAPVPDPSVAELENWTQLPVDQLPTAVPVIDRPDPGVYGTDAFYPASLVTLPGSTLQVKCDAGFTVPIIVPKFASIEVVKSLNPANDTGLFNLQIDGVSKVTNVGNGGTTGKVPVPAGTNANPGATHTVGETAGTNTTLANYTSSISCVKRGTTTVVASGSGAGPLNVSVMPDDDILCTITNSGAAIEIRKMAYNKSDQLYCPDRIFGFSLTSMPAFFLSSASPDCPADRTSSVTKAVAPNTNYTVAETDPDINDTSIPPTGWDLFNVTCTGGIGSGFVWTPGSVSVTGQVAPGGKVVCTFKNRQRSDLAVDLVRFDAAWSGKSVLVTWQTNSEIGNLGFNLYRQSGNGPVVQLNSGLIWSKSPGGTAGAEYTWTDKTVKPGRTYQYFLDDVADDGTVTRHGPIVPTGQKRK